MKKLILIYMIFCVNLLLGSQISLDPTQHVRAMKTESGCTGISYDEGDTDVGIEVNVSCTSGQMQGVEHYFTYSAYQFDLSSIPSGAYDISAQIEAWVDPALNGTSVIITYGYDGINWNSFEDVWNSIPSSFMELSTNGAHSTYDVSSSVSERLIQGYINFGAKPTGDNIPGWANIHIKLNVTFTTVVNITADNNFIALGGADHGAIKVGTVQTAPYGPFQKTPGTSLTLEAISPQTNNLGHQMYGILLHVNKVNGLEMSLNSGPLIKPTHLRLKQMTIIKRIWQILQK